MDHEDVPFWRRKTLEQLTKEEWESLCDGCGRCCLLKLEDEDTAEVHLTRLACRLLDRESCRCSDYANRHTRVHDCLAIDPESLKTLEWLPQTCGYRLVGEGRDLEWWHPLVSGDPETVHAAGISVRGWSMSEEKVKPDDLYRYIVRGEPRRRRKSARNRASGSTAPTPPVPPATVKKA